MGLSSRELFLGRYLLGKPTLLAANYLHSIYLRLWSLDAAEMEAKDRALALRLRSEKVSFDRCDRLASLAV